MLHHELPAEVAPDGRLPSWASVALPEKAIGSPTFQVNPVLGDVIVAVGGVLPARIATESVADAPWLSVTRTPTR